MAKSYLQQQLEQTQQKLAREKRDLREMERDERGTAADIEELRSLLKRAKRPFSRDVLREAITDAQDDSGEWAIKEARRDIRTLEREIDAITRDITRTKSDR